MMKAWLPAIIGLFAMTTSALAQDDNLAACLARSAPEVEIGACTAVLGDGKQRSAKVRAVIFNNRGISYWKLKRYIQAIADFDESVALNPRDPTTFYNRAEAYRWQGDNERAIEDYTRAITMKPDFSHPYNGRGNAYRNLGRYALAIADYNRASQINPNVAVVYANRGDTYVLMKEYGKAVSDYNTAIARDRNLTRAYFGRGEAFLAGGDAQRAVAEFSTVLKLEPEHQKALAMLGQAENQLQPTAPAGRIAVAAPSAPVAGQRRIALVIGNASYGIGRLVNPANDAADVGSQLKALGFEVITGLDLSKAGFGEALARFEDQARGADAALLYYSGHALQVNGENWLLPVDTRSGSLTEVQQSNISLQELLRGLETRAKVTLVFLDACRNNPFSSRLNLAAKSDSRSIVVAPGLARVAVEQPNTLVVFATQPNDVAADGEGRNSPFTSAFLANVATPGVEIETLMKRVTADVIAGTASKQRPERLSGLTSEFYFATR